MERKRMSLTKTIKKEKSLLEAKEEFIEKMKGEEKSPHTIKGYSDILRRFFKFIGDEDVCNVTNKDIEDYKKFLKLTCRNTTINTNLIHLGVFFNNFCYRKGYCDKLEFNRVKVTEVKKEVYSTDDIVELLIPFKKETFMQFQIRVTIGVFCSTGLRTSELLSLLVKDVDLKHNVIYTRHTKTNNPRIVPISKSLKGLLEEWLVKRQYSDENDTLFCNCYGEILSRNALQNAMYRYIKKKGLKQTGIHKFRRTFITNAINNNIDIIRLARITGHKQLATLNMYYTQNIKELNKIADKVSILENLDVKEKKTRKK